MTQSVFNIIIIVIVFLTAIAVFLFRFFNEKRAPTKSSDDTSKPIIVYLAGPINGCDDSTAKDWREYAKRNLNTWTLDPMSRDFRGRETEPGVAAEIVEGDKDDIDASGILLVNATIPSVGTSMEVLYAHEQGKIVVSVYTSEKSPSPWLVYHSDVVVKSLDEGIRAINDYLAQEDMSLPAIFKELGA